jgi:CubicO group peptidase (beta-lactamase class C family)
MASWTTGNTPGAAILVVQHGQVVLKKGYGLANLKTRARVTPTTAFLLCSLTKSFTAMAVVILAERGYLRYEEPLSRLFPEFPAYARKITVRHLLTHTSGLPDYEQLWLASGRIDREWPRSAKGKRSPYEPTARDTLQLLARQRVLRFDPGGRWEYSNSGYVVLAQIVEKVSGEPYARFVHRNIFQPLGMTNSVVSDEMRRKVRRRATSYTQEGTSYREIDYTPLNLIYGADNVYSTLEDLERWEEAWGRGKLVTAPAFRQALTPGKLNDGRLVGYGFGWHLSRLRGLACVAHTGRWLGFNTIHLRYPEQHLAVIVLANVAQFDVPAVAHHVAEIYLG